MSIVEDPEGKEREKWAENFLILEKNSRYKKAKEYQIERLQKDPH